MLDSIKMEHFDNVDEPKSNVSNSSCCRNLFIYLSIYLSIYLFIYFYWGFPTLKIIASENLSCCNYFLAYILFCQRCINLDVTVIITFFLSPLLTH